MSHCLESFFQSGLFFLLSLSLCLGLLESGHVILCCLELFSRLFRLMSLFVSLPVCLFGSCLVRVLFWCCLALSCVLSCFDLVLSCFVLFLSYLVLSCLVLSCPVLSCLVLPCHVLSGLVFSCSCLYLVSVVPYHNSGLFPHTSSSMKSSLKSFKVRANAIIMTRLLLSCLVVIF